jgi:hypothetical protein
MLRSRCKAKPGEACDILKNVVELIHVERIEAAITLDALLNNLRFEDT